jgi:redox-sensitive bicupin YhaK (pirin superfamily)
MIHLRKSDDRGRTEIGWLKSRHSFSFGSYFDPKFMGFGPLRVINEDWVEPGEGFPTHGHANMEIITYIVDGELEHRDSLGSGSVIERGEVQRMTAGTGIQHSEFNPSSQQPVHLLQIWLQPEKNGLTPSYEEKIIADDEKRNRLRLVAGGDGRDGAMAINQKADVYASLLDPGKTVDHKLGRNRLGWVQVVDGALTVNGQTAGPGDGLAIAEEDQVTLTAGDKPAEFLLFDMAA